MVNSVKWKFIKFHDEALPNEAFALKELVVWSLWPSPSHLGKVEGIE